MLEVIGILNWGPGTDEQYIECRQCGQAVDDADEACPLFQNQRRNAQVFR